jgi:hypothetical protein
MKATGFKLCLRARVRILSLHAVISWFQIVSFTKNQPAPLRDGSVDGSSGSGGSGIDSPRAGGGAGAGVAEVSRSAGPVDSLGGSTFASAAGSFQPVMRVNARQTPVGLYELNVVDP